MASYTISPIWGAGAQLFDNNGNPLVGGKIYTYYAGSTTPLTTYTDPTGNTANTNPIITNSAGRLVNEIWFPVSGSYKFVLKDANDVLIATYDNIPTTPQPLIVNDASSVAYEPGYEVTAGGFTVGATYLITSVGTTDFVAIGAAANVTGIYFTATGVGSGTGTAEYSRTVQDKLRETVSVKDFGAVGDGVTDDTAAIQAVVDAYSSVYLPAGEYLIGQITIPNNCYLFGDGINTVLYVKNGLNTHAIVVTGTTGVRFANFKINGNSTNQSGSSANCIFGTGVNDFEARGVTIYDPNDWGMAFYGASDNIRLYDCHAIEGKAGANANAVRAGFMFGTSGSPTSECTNVICEGCTAYSTAAYRNGFMSDWGGNHQYIGCRAEAAYTGFKIKAYNVLISGCYAKCGTQGFQTQLEHNYSGLTMVGNTAVECGHSGYFFNVLTGTCKGWVITGNLAMNNGQGVAPSTSYGFAFELSAGATVNDITLCGNTASDSQATKTQTRGISFGEFGTVDYICIADNVTKDNSTTDYYAGTSLTSSSHVLKGWNLATFGSSSTAAYPSISDTFRFWVNNVSASSGTLTLSDSVGSRGYVMPNAGFIKSMTVKGNAATTAGSCTFQLRVNGSIVSSFNVTINSTYQTFRRIIQGMFSSTFSSGDMITVSCVSDGSFSPSGTTDFDVAVEVVYL